MKRILLSLIISAPIWAMQPSNVVKGKNPTITRLQKESRRFALSALAYETASYTSVPLYGAAMVAFPLSLPTVAMGITKFYLAHLIASEIAEKTIRDHNDNK